MQAGWIMPACALREHIAKPLGARQAAVV